MTYKPGGGEGRTHVNPGTDTTINPVVIDDSKREKKPEYDPIFIGLINYFKEIQWQRVESEFSVTEIIEILTDFAKMEAEEMASHTNAPSHPLEAQRPRPPCEECIYQAKAAEAQQRIKQAFQEIEGGIKAYEKEHEHKQVSDNNGMYIPTNVVRRLLEVRKDALLQAGRK